MNRMLLFSFLIVLAIGNSTAQTLTRSIALLDLTERNSETNDGQLFSAEHILKVTGISYTITSTLLDAEQYAVIFCSSYLDSKTLSSEEKNSLIDYVSNGGIVIAPRVTDEDLFSLFGVSGVTESNSNFLVNWNNSLTTPLYRWIDEPEEWTISLGRVGGGIMFKTASYNLSSAIDLARYENETVAVTQNQFSNGFAYIFGFTWKEVILRSQINRDIEAQRVSSNGFEPSMDVIMLFMRAIFNKHIPYSTWKHTSPKNSSSTLMITHDVDSSTGMDSMFMFSESEKNLEVSASYNVTVRYFDDALMTDFYNGHLPDVQKLITDGHIIGSHSVGHFPDFGNDDIFPIGNPGNTRESYSPYNDGSITVGGTVYGECEVSKDVLESDLGVDIRMYRTGHLVYNKYLVEVLDELGYKYNSSYSANEVLTNFPYQNKTGRSFSGTNSNIYELPVSISDVYHADPMSEDNYLEKVGFWLDIISKIDANNASTVLLIHPNRGYKLLGEEYLISHLPGSITIKEMSAFGDYWRVREAFDFTTQKIDNTIQIKLSDQSSTLDKEISLIINNGQDLDAVSMSMGTSSIDFDTENWGENDLILYNFKFALGLHDLSDFGAKWSLYPNPVCENIFIEMDLINPSKIDIELVDRIGKTIKKKQFNQAVPGHQIITFKVGDLQLPSGLYFCRIKVDKYAEVVKKVIIE